jgi:hypothetical protein
MDTPIHLHVDPWHRALDSKTGRSLATYAAQSPAGPGAGKLSIPEHEPAPHKDVGNADGRPPRLGVGRLVRHDKRVNHREVGNVPVPDEAPVPQPEPAGGVPGEVQARLRPRPVAELPYVTSQEPRERAPPAGVRDRPDENPV